MRKILPFGSVRSEHLISPSELAKELPVTIAQTQFVEQSRERIVRILTKEDRQLLLIMGPCSVHDLASAEHYAEKLKILTSTISDVFLPIMRVYFEKPRTTVGWKGIMHDPHLDGSFDVNTGLRLTRQLLLKLAELGVPAAAEILDPVSGQYFGELLSWCCIGARTASSQLHRQVASGLPMPVAFKNNTDGNIEIAVQGVLAASFPHAYIGINEEGKASILHTQGNPHCHVVLRGGEKAPNYDSESVTKAINLLKKAKLPPAVIVDCSHDNSRRDHLKQPHVFENVLQQILTGNDDIRGFILESHLRAGSQEIVKNRKLLKYAVSLTDSCIDWETTENLLTASRSLLLVAPKAKASKTLETCPVEHESHNVALV